MKKLADLLAGIPMTIAGGICLLLSFVLPRVGIVLPIDPAWITILISGIPLLYLVVWRIIHNSGIRKISSALLITIAMLAAIAIGDWFAAGEVAIFFSNLRNYETCIAPIIHVTYPPYFIQNI